MNFDPAMSKNEHVKREKDGLDVWNDIFQYARTGFASIPEADFGRMMIVESLGRNWSATYSLT